MNTNTQEKEEQAGMRLVIYGSLEYGELRNICDKISSMGYRCFIDTHSIGFIKDPTVEVVKEIKDEKEPEQAETKPEPEIDIEDMLQNGICASCKLVNDDCPGVDSDCMRNCVHKNSKGTVIECSMYKKEEFILDQQAQAPIRLPIPPMPPIRTSSGTFAPGTKNKEVKAIGQPQTAPNRAKVVPR